MTIPFDAYESVIGFECHIQLKTNSKLFSFGQNKYGAPPNSLVDAVDIGLPGVLPVLNKKAVDFAIKLGLALGCKIRSESIFARKHYFYPDLPKGYQISQFDKPICENGKLNILVDGVEKSIRIMRIHLEEDAGKNIHIDGVNASYIDFNRAGTPLLEVVTEPDLRTAKEAVAAFKQLRQIVTYLDICDGNMQEGSLRADLNLSVRKIGEEKLGTRTETKNINSFRFFGQAIAFEARRQIIEIESGNKIIQETRLWDPNLKESRAMRSKEEAHDYRYFPDPDLLPLRLSSTQISEIASLIGEMPLTKLKRYQAEYALSEYDAQLLTSTRSLSKYFEEAIAHHNNPKSIANWIINELFKGAKESQEGGSEEVNEFLPPVKALQIAYLVKLIDDNIISSNIAKKVLLILEKHPDKMPDTIVKENNWQVLSNQDDISLMVKQVLKENPEEVAKYLAGKTKILGFLMGQLMKLSKGQVDPQKATALMEAALKEQA